MLSEDHDITAQLFNSPVTIVTHKRFAFLFFLLCLTINLCRSLQTRFATIKCYTNAVCFSYNYVLVLKETE